MCGVAGIVGPGVGVDAEAQTRRMLSVLTHRGPDDEGLVRLDGVVLGSRRLAIVDAPGGHQPLRHGGAWVAMNGEIYNHNALRKELAAQGRRFSTRSDTEVVAALVDELGVEQALTRLDGMFAIAVWEPNTRALTLARDRMGEKPLYWTRRGDTLRFASELKGLLSLPDQPRQLCPDALHQLLMFEYIPAPRSIYQGVFKLQPGHLLRIDPEGLRITPWWRPPVPGANPSRLEEPRWERAVLSSLQIAVKQRLDTELPVAVTLSGGIDSSAVLAFAARLRPETPPHTFTVTFDEPSFDEGGPAALMAKHVGATHHAVPLPASALPEALDDLTARLCEPLADGSLVPTRALYKAIHEAGFRVSIGGDGADELFGGYPTYLAHPLAERLSALGPVARALVGRLPTSTENLSKTFMAQRFAEGLGLPWARRDQVWLGAFTPRELLPLTGRAPLAAWDVVDAWAEAAAAAPEVAGRAMYLNQRLYLGEGVLTKVDRASMLSSVEARAPFLCHRLVALAADIPVAAHLRGGQTKALLRRSVAELLPPALTKRPKKGFGAPLGPWLAGPMRGLLDGLDDALAGLIDGELVRRLVREHTQGQADHRRRLWTLLILARWSHGPWGPRSRPS
ncbi:MAG: asparagine synthase (glutamine-hydrolyzing) [Deltaproteobacteria bacterium]|nr:asparagine synthase (glutamine-hydrolyzing) [Deltaproteobacteria bacterium]